MTDSLITIIDSTYLMDSLIQHEIDSITAAEVVHHVVVDNTEETMKTILAISTIVILVAAGVGYHFYNKRFWERGVFPPLTNRSINRFEAIICLAVNIIRCDKEGYPEKQAILLSFMRRKFPQIDGGVVRSMKLALARPMSTTSISKWLCKHIRDPKERLEILDLLFLLSTMDGAIGRMEYVVLREFANVMEINGQQLDDRIAAFKRLKAEQLRTEQERDRLRKVSSVSDKLRLEYLVVLGLNGDVSVDEVKKAYRVLVKQFHPDRFQGLSKEAQKQMEHQFIRIQEAYEYLIR